MISILFWNLKTLDRGEVCCRLIQRWGIDVLVLAECRDPISILKEINPVGQRPEFLAFAKKQGNRISIFARRDQFVFDEIESTRYATALSIRRMRSLPITLIGTHLPSKTISRVEKEQPKRIRELSRWIQMIEVRVGCLRTILIGDLNVDPFEVPVYSDDGLKSVSTRALANRRISTTPVFYNPMWRFFGDDNPGPAGTYFDHRSGSQKLYWHMFDQVLLRPALLPCFSDDNLAIITHDGKVELGKGHGFPDSEVGSDHFPLLIRLDETRIIT